MTLSITMFFQFGECNDFTLFMLYAVLYVECLYAEYHYAELSWCHLAT